MTVQLALLTSAEPEWKISEQTREVGRRGLAEARAALHNTIRTHPSLHDPAPDTSTVSHHNAAA